jgi:hypothetical protein
MMNARIKIGALFSIASATSGFTPSRSLFHRGPDCWIYINLTKRTILQWRILKGNFHFWLMFRTGLNTSRGIGEHDM